MSWSRSRAEARIRRFLDTAPTVLVERYAEDYLPRYQQLREATLLAGEHTRAEAPPLFDLPNGRAVLVDTVQVYVRALSYDDVRLDEGRETPASHARGLAFLHMLYSAGDRVVEHAGGQRVDHHGARMHAVVIEPRGNVFTAERIAAAIALAEEMIDLARGAGRELFPSMNLQLHFRVGIDIGSCVAINSGRSDEREPMFVGSAANHAAKLAAGDEEGIYLSDRIRAVFGLRRASTLDEERAMPASAGDLQRLRAALPQLRDSLGLTRTRLDEWIEDRRQGRVPVIGPEAFSFHQHTPPLRSIEYDKLTPVNSIRMPLVSIFADLDNYTRFIDRCMSEGRLAEAVRLLHILRSEFNAVLQEDFDGRKVRHIGDSIHGLLAEGTAHEVDERGTITLAASCAGALRSSFKLCQEMIPAARELGLAIGFECGKTPVSRIGIRGERAVRVASSLTVRASEACQRECDGEETMIGDAAYRTASPSVRQLFGPARIVRDLTYDDVVTQVEPKRVAAKVVGLSPILSHAPTVSAPSRAYVE